MSTFLAESCLTNPAQGSGISDCISFCQSISSCRLSNARVFICRWCRGKFHQTRTSPDFKLAWAQLMKLTLEKPASPIFYQSVTDVLFKELIKQHLSTPTQVAPTTDFPPLDYQEVNALRYAAGYVPRALRKRLEKRSHPLKEELVLCLVELCEEDDLTTDSSADWTNQITRG